MSSGTDLTDWGVQPVLFHIGNIPIPSYSFFMLLALLAATMTYIIYAKKSSAYNENAFYIAAGAIVGGVLGAKLPIWIANYQVIFSSFPDITPLLSGRTVIGGLIGGTVGVALVKKRLKIKTRMGNQLAPAIALGMGIARIGCFLQGCCYGKPTGLSWGINFGDGTLRFPTQLFEAVFDFGMFIVLLWLGKRINEPGKLFRVFVTSYFVFRFFIEFIRVEPMLMCGLTGYQLAALLGILYINREIFITRRGA